MPPGAPKTRDMDIALLVQPPVMCACLQEDRVMTEIYTILRYLYGSEHQSESNVVKPESATAPRGSKSSECHQSDE
eukprot:5975380-Amphidinium_carterae.2